MAYRRIRFRNFRIQTSDALLVFDKKRKFFHITPLLRAIPPHFYTFEARSPPLPRFYLFRPSTPHFYCFPSNTTSTTFHCFPPPQHTHMYTHTISTFLLFSTHHLHHVSFVFPAPPPPPQFYCFPSTIFTTTSFLLFFIHNLQHISIVSHPLHSPHFYWFPAPLPPPHSYCFPFTTTITFLLFSIHHLNHISIVFRAPPPPHFYCFPLPPPSIPDFKSFPLLHHHPLIFMFSSFPF